MKPQYQHELMTSFLLFFDHHLLQKGEAYSNQSGRLFPFSDDRLPSSFDVFASPYKQWVTDSSIVGDTNPNIPTGFMGTGRSNTAADNSAITGFDLSNVGQALSTSSENFDGHYNKIPGIGGGRLVFRNDAVSFLRIAKNNSSNVAQQNKWEIKNTANNTVAWRSPSTTFTYPWQVNDWQRVQAQDGVGTIPTLTSFLVQGSEGFVMDFENGRVLVTGGAAALTDYLTGTFAVKDFNIYVTNDTEEDLILNSSFELNSRYGENIADIPTLTNNGISDAPNGVTGVKPYDKTLPAIFVNSETMSNQGYAFGGEDKTTNSIKAVVMAENQYQLDGVLSIFADTRHKSFAKIPFTGYPVTEYGDLKNGSYNYVNLSKEFSTSNDYIIDNVITSKLSERAQTNLPGEIKVGFIDFDVSTTRFPRA